MSDTLATILSGAVVTIITQTIGYLALRRDLREVKEEQKSLRSRLVAVETVR